MSWFNSTLHKVGEMGGYILSGGLAADALHRVADGQYKFAAFEGLLSLYAAFSSYLNEQRRESIEQFESFAEGFVEDVEKVRNGPLAELKLAIENLGNKPEPVTAPIKSGRGLDLEDFMELAEKVSYTEKRPIGLSYDGKTRYPLDIFEVA